MLLSPSTKFFVLCRWIYTMRKNTAVAAFSANSANLSPNLMKNWGFLNPPNPKIGLSMLRGAPGSVPAKRRGEIFYAGQWVGNMLLQNRQPAILNELIYHISLFIILSRKLPSCIDTRLVIHFAGRARAFTTCTTQYSYGGIKSNILA